MSVSNLQKQIRALPRRVKAVELCQAGVSNREIATRLGVSEVRVHQYLKEHWERASRHPSGLSISELELRRTQRREDMETARQKILTEMALLGGAKDIPYGSDDRCSISTAMCRLSDSLMRIEERMCAMDGLDAPRKSEAKVTNNMQVVVANDYFKELQGMAEARVLQVTNGDGQNGD